MQIKVSNTLFSNASLKTSDHLYETVVKGENVFYANDCSNTGYATNWATPISTSATDLFESPSTGNFKVKLPAYESYGDPRWNK